MASLRLVPASGSPIEITTDQVLLGRDPSCDVVLADGSVSRRHARIERRGAEWAVVDQGSANGTFVDSRRVAESAVQHGQELRFGALSYRVEIEGAEAEAATIAGPAPLPSETVIQPAPPPPPARPAASTPPLPRPRAAQEGPTAEVQLPPPPPLPAPPPRAGSSAPPPPPPPAAPRAGAPARPSAPAPPRAGAPPARQGRSPLFWVGAGCCGCLLLLLLTVGGCLSFAWLSTAEPVKVVRAQLAEIKAGNGEASYARLSQDFRSRITRADFEAFVSRTPALAQATDSTFWQRSVEGNTAKLSGILTSPAGPATIAISLVKVSGEWKIDSIQVDGREPAHEEGAAAPSGGELSVETTQVEKRPAADGTQVTVKVRVAGFATRSENGSHRIDLAGDLETLAPDGTPVPGLSKADFHRLNELAAAPSGTTADFTTDLTLGSGNPPGTYTVRLTIRDKVGGSSAVHEVPFDLP